MTFWVTLFFLVNSWLPGHTGQDGPEITGADTTLYSQEFIDALREVDYLQSVEFYEDYMILDNGPSVHFPENPPWDTTLVFRGSHKKVLVVLALTRYNYTSLHYDIHISRANGESVERTGNAHLGATFYLASEIDTDDSTGYAYAADEFREDDDDQGVVVRIGQNDAEELLAHVIIYGAGTTTLNLGDCPTLRLK